MRQLLLHYKEAEQSNLEDMLMQDQDEEDYEDEDEEEEVQKITPPNTLARTMQNTWGRALALEVCGNGKVVTSDAALKLKWISFINTSKVLITLLFDVPGVTLTNESTLCYTHIVPSCPCWAHES